MVHAIAGIPVAAGVAVIRHQLWDADVDHPPDPRLRRVSALLAGTYVAVVIGLQAVFSSFAGGSDLAIAVSTLAVAALFLPVRSRVQGFVDRRFYRRRYDAQRTLEAFGARLREQVDLDALRADLAQRRPRDDAAGARLGVAARETHRCPHAPVTRRGLGVLPHARCRGRRASSWRSCTGRTDP